MKKILFAGAEVMPFGATGGLGDVLGSLPAAVKRELSESGIKFEVIGSGDAVAEQSPNGGNVINLETGRLILYTNNQDGEDKLTPSFTGLTVYDANLLAARLGIEVVFSSEYTLNSACIVISQSIAAGELLRGNSIIKLGTAYTDFED